MARPTKYRRSLEAIMQADYVRLEDEAPVKWPIASQTWRRYEKEKRIRTYGSPKMIYTPEAEAQIKAGFPVLEELLQRTAHA